MSNPVEGAKGVVKFEHDDRLSATLGTGPPIASPSALSEDDIYEDAGDLEFPQGDQTVWLMRLPTFLWERWSTLGDDEEIEIGKVRVGTADKLTLFLSPNVDALKDLPKEYDLNMINQHSTNTYIFTEKDLPGYNSKQGQKPGAGISKPSIPTRLLRRDRGHSKTFSKGEKWKRSEPYYRKAIPKRTAIAGVVKHEVACLPVESEAYVRLVAERNELASKPKRQTQRMKGLPNSNIQPGTGLKISTATKQKSQEQKATRVSKEQLLDAIYACFKEYEYWSLKSMRARLRQPETYLKETLEPIAELVKTGRFAMHWTLKPSYKEASYKGAEAAAPEASPEFETGSDLDDGSNEEDGNDDEMEDVVPP